jgi:hypothetical protein
VQIRGRRQVHCAYHKCLTVLFQNVVGNLYRARLGPAGEYRHFDSRLDEFYRECEAFTVASVNNQVVDLDRFEDIHVTRFVRDPRDLIVSGYFYHKRAAERWCDVVDPTEADWTNVNGYVPDHLGNGRSFAKHLNEVSLEDGLLAEMEFRRHHFESMRLWPKEDPRIEVYRYEEIVGNEVAIFDRIFQGWALDFRARQIGLHFVRKFRASKRSGFDDHIRDPRSGQWREVFTPRVTHRFEQEYADLLDLLGYTGE